MKKSIAIAGFLGIFLSQVVSSSAAYFTSAPLSRCNKEITQTLQIGSQNNEVVVLQQLLANAGFLNANPNGYFGYGTQSAVRAFQANNGITATGVVGATTRNAINERLCDSDLIDNTISSSNWYDNTSSITYVGETDPYVQVINPPVSLPAVYANGLATTLDTLSAIAPLSSSLPSSVITDPFLSNQSSLSPSYTPTAIQSSGIVYNPLVGYTYGFMPTSGSITVTSPVGKSVYKEGDTVFVQWSADNLVVSQVSISLENTISGQSKVITVTSAHSYSFVLTKDLLDQVCMNVCKNSQKETFKIVVSTPVKDMIGAVSTLRAAVAPVTITRPQGVGAVSVTASRNPATSGELFKLYINTPSEISVDPSTLENYTVLVRAICPIGVTVVVAAVPCGQDFAAPFSRVFGERGVPTTITNPTWYKQDVIYEVSLVDTLGQVVGFTKTVVTGNPAPFSW